MSALWISLLRDTAWFYGATCRLYMLIALKFVKTFEHRRHRADNLKLKIRPLVQVIRQTGRRIFISECGPWYSMRTRANSKESKHGTTLDKRCSMEGEGVGGDNQLSGCAAPGGSNSTRSCVVSYELGK